ncbi:MAG: 2OG-Fe(II) oxygenase [Parcubacteria group bacterium]
MLSFHRFTEIEVRDRPFRHLVGSGFLDRADADELAEDFPDPGKTGFFPAEELRCGPAFEALIDELRSYEFSREVGERLGLDLTEHPQMIVVRRWSAAKDGRPHTDGRDKVATALLYLNEVWTDGAGCLRYLEGPDLDGPGSEPIPPRYGMLTAFSRSETSWHGHKPFTGERRAVQVFWLKDDAALKRKSDRHKRTAFWRLFSPGVHA